MLYFSVFGTHDSNKGAWSPATSCVPIHQPEAGTPVGRWNQRREGGGEAAGGMEVTQNTRFSPPPWFLLPLGCLELLDISLLTSHLVAFFSPQEGDMLLKVF